jgi:hypothetical protein
VGEHREKPQCRHKLILDLLCSFWAMCSGKWCKRNISTPNIKMNSTRKTPITISNTSFCPGPVKNHGGGPREAKDWASIMRFCSALGGLRIG